mgnify:CR=1 FL=1
MKKIVCILLLVGNIVFAQQAFHNFGNLKIHENGQLGFHIDLINDGTFNQNAGLAGFYNQSNSLKISGTNAPMFFNLEVDVINDLFLDISTEISNALIYVEGKIVTPRENPSITLQFLDDVVYGMEDYIRYTDGYASYSGKNAFTFPIGHDDMLRPISIPFNNTVGRFSAAYFNEDYNYNPAFQETFNNSISNDIIKNISINEFWDFNGTTETKITLSWNPQSEINSLTEDLQNLRVIGWNVIENQWIDLGNEEINGNLNSGTITSAPFIPNDYLMISFGSLTGIADITVYNEFSPNNDGVNDTFVIKGIKRFENKLQIFNRSGKIVYETTNYQNDWNGEANSSLLLDKNKELPIGTYYYILELPNENKKYASWIYINR